MQHSRKGEKCNEIYNVPGTSFKFEDFSNISTEARKLNYDAIGIINRSANRKARKALLYFNYLPGRLVGLTLLVDKSFV